MVRIYFESSGTQRAQRFRVFTENVSAVLKCEVREEVEPALRDDVGFKGADRSRRGIARIGEFRELQLFSLRVHTRERSERHDDLAPHLEIRRQPGLLQYCGRDRER